MATEEYDGCQVSRPFFKRVTSHLRQGDPKDGIELDLLEESLGVCR
jgi:hypothetical protein